MKNTTKLELRMYSLVMYNLSPIQKAIQAYHASIEYTMEYFNDQNFQQWATEDKTVIILSGGGSQEMILNSEEIKLLGLKYAKFHEPDLNFSLSAISFLLDERVFNREKYPDFRDFMKLNYPDVANRDFHNYEKRWVEILGGEEIIKQREFISKFKLA